MGLISPPPKKKPVRDDCLKGDYYLNRGGETCMKVTGRGEGGGRGG